MTFEKEKRRSGEQRIFHSACKSPGNPLVGIILLHFGVDFGDRDELKFQAEDRFRKSKKGYERLPAPPGSPPDWSSGLVLIHFASGESIP